MSLRLERCLVFVLLLSTPTLFARADSLGPGAPANGAPTPKIASPSPAGLELLGTKAEGASTGAPAPAPSGAGKAGGDLRINGRVFKGLTRVSSRYGKVEDAAAVTAHNGVDEIYLRDQDGALYIVYGYYGGLGQRIHVGQRGTSGGRILEVVHVDDEMNTNSEGVFEGFSDVWKMVQPVTRNLGPTALSAAGAIAGYIGVKACTGVALSAAVPACAAATITTAEVVAAGLAATTAFFVARDVFLAHARRNPETIAMVTADSAAGIDAGTTIGRTLTRDRSPGESFTEVIRRTGPHDDGPGYDDLPATGRSDN